MSNKLLEAVAVAKFVCPRTGKIVGYEYRWNTNHSGYLMFGEMREDLIRTPIEEASKAE